MKPTIVRHYVLAALLVITAINYVQRNCISPAATTIERTIGISRTGLDAAAGAFFLAYTLMQVPSGWLAKLWGPRLALAFYAAGWSLAVALCAAATGFWTLWAGRVLLGILQAGIFPCATLILASWYPATLRGTATALLNSFMLVGGAAGTMISGQLLTVISWQSMFLIYAIPGIVWALWFLWWFRDSPDEHPSVNEAERNLLAADRPATKSNEPVPFRTALVAALAVPLLLLYTQQCFRAATPRLFDSRLPTYFEGRLVPPEEISQMSALVLAPASPGMPLASVAGGLGGWARASANHRQVVAAAANLSSWPQWSGVVGGLVGGMLSDYVLRRTGNRRWAHNGVAIGSLLMCLLWYAAAWLATDLHVSAILLAVGFFFFNFSSPCAYALTIDMGGKYLPVVFGLMNMIGNVGAWLFVSSVMWMVGMGGWPLAFGVWASLHVWAILCWLFLDSERKIA